MKSFYLRKEYKKLRNLVDGGFLPEPMFLFSWAMIEKNKYVVISPKMFRRQEGDVITIMTEKQFARLFRQLNTEAK